MRRGRADAPSYATALPLLSLVAFFLSVALSEALLRFRHHHHHHAVVLPKDSSYYFAISHWNEEVKASSSRTCVEHGGAVRSALGSGVHGTDRDWITKTFDYINHVFLTLPLSDLQGYVDAISPLIDVHLVD